MAARAQVRTAALAAELLQLGVSGGLLVGEAAAAVSIGDGLLFRGSQGIAEVFAVGCLTSIPMVSAYAASLLCCDPGGSWPGAFLEQTFKVLASLALAEVIFLCITGAFQPSMHALAWPLAVAVCFGRAAVAWTARSPPEPLPPRPVGVRPARLRKAATEKSQQTEVKVRLRFEGLNLEKEEWRESLREHLAEQGISAETCAQLQISVAEGLVEITGPPEVATLGTSSVAVSVSGKGHHELEPSQTSQMSQKLQEKLQLQEQVQKDLEQAMNICNQSIQELDGKVRLLEEDCLEQQRKVQSLEAKTKLQLRLAQHEPSRELPRERAHVAQLAHVEAEASGEAAKRMVERTRRDLEAQMAVLSHQFGQVSRDLESLSRAAALARASECDVSARTLRKYLVEALVRPSLDEAQQLALRLLSQALDAATLLSASAMAPQAEAKAPVEIFQKYESLEETRRMHEELVAQRLQELLAKPSSRVDLDAAPVRRSLPVPPAAPAAEDATT